MSGALAQRPWLARPAWVDAAVAAYTASELDPVKILVTAQFDPAAVSDGSAGCHWKDASHIAASVLARQAVGAKLDALINAITLCNKVVASQHHQVNSPSLADAEASFAYATQQLVAIRTKIDPAALALLADCLRVAQHDEWTRTPFGKGILVRTRRTFSNKSALENSIQRRLLDAAINRHPDTAPGFRGELGKAIRRMQRTSDKGMPLLHFAPMTLDAILNSYASSTVTALNVTRIRLSGDGSNVSMALKRDYTFHFKHVDGRYQYVSYPELSEQDVVGMIWEGECKYREDQAGQGLCSADDVAWADYIRENFGPLLLVYLFNHTAFPDGSYTKENTRTALAAISGRAANQFSMADADRQLREFDFRGNGNQKLIDLFAMATMERPGFGTGVAKYIETIKHGFAYKEPVETVGLNFHHILAGSAGRAKKIASEMDYAHHKDGAAPELGVHLLVAGQYAVPWFRGKQFEDMIDEEADGRQPDQTRIISGVDLALYTRNRA